MLQPVKCGGPEMVVRLWQRLATPKEREMIDACLGSRGFIYQWGLRTMPYSVTAPRPILARMMQFSIAFASLCTELRDVCDVFMSFTRQ
jgi:hypothetical protein